MALIPLFEESIPHRNLDTLARMCNHGTIDTMPDEELRNNLIAEIKALDEKAGELIKKFSNSVK